LIGALAVSFLISDGGDRAAWLAARERVVHRIVVVLASFAVEAHQFVVEERRAFDLGPSNASNSAKDWIESREENASVSLSKTTQVTHLGVRRKDPISAR